MFKKISAAAMVAASLALVACGGSDSKKKDDSTASSGASNKALSYSDFGTQADAICAKVNGETKAAAQGLTGQADSDSAILTEIVPKFKSGLDEFKKLTPPAELKSTFDEFVAVSDEQLAAELEALTFAEAGDQESYVAAIQKVQPLSQKSDELGSQLGSPACAGSDA
jgi:Flp pilus assembly protein TadD